MHLVSTVRSLAPVQAWKPDVGALTLPTTCAGTLPLATVRSVTGGATLQQPSEAGVFNPLLDGAFTSTGSLFCQWFATGPPISPARPPLTQQTGLGTAAFGGCQSNGTTSACDLFVLANHTWFELRQDDSPTHPATLSALTSLARSYLTTIGFAN